MSEIIYELPSDNQEVLIKMQNFEGVWVEAIYIEAEQLFQVVASGLFTFAPLVLEWKPKEV